MTKRSQHLLLLSDQRGAAMFMGVFFAVFLVGAAYYVLGVGEAVIQRQRMQDAADAGAFAAAVLHARGMNIIALINTMMAALLSVLVLLKLMEALLTIAILALSVAAFFTAGSTSGLIAPLTRVRNIVQNVENKVEPIVNRGLQALHWGNKSIRVLMPAAAELRVVDTVVHEYGDVAYFGFALPMSLTLPVEPDKFSVVCGEAGKIVGQLATLPVRGIAPEQILGVVEDAAKALTESLQAYFCGGGSGEPPAFTPPDKNIQLPKLASRAACEDNQEPKSAEGLCRQAAIDEAQGEPFGFRESEAPRFDTPPGECRPGPVKYGEPLGGLTANKQALTFKNIERDCGKYQQWVASAASQCNPYAESNPYHDDVSNFIWQEATKEDWWKFIKTPNGTTWEKQTLPNPEAYFKAQHVVRGDDLPKYCTSTNYDPNGDALCVSPKKDWLVICPDAKAPDGTPLLCHPSALKPLPKEAQIGSMLMMSYPVVRRMLGCEGKMKVEAVKLNLKPGGGITNQDKKSSFKLADDALLGEDIFQLRVVVLGKDIGEAGMNRVKVALYGPQDAHADVLNQLRHVGQLSVAQAEYFTTEADGQNQEEVEERRQWMWTPHWRARLRRIWIPTEFSHANKSGEDPDLKSMAKHSQVSTSIEQSCQNAKGSSGTTVDTSQCAKSDKPGGLGGFVRGLSEIFIH